MTNPRNPLPLLCGIGGNIIWGFSYLFTRVAQQSAAPILQIALRFALAFLLMNLLLLTGKQKLHLKGKKLRPLLTMAALEPLYFFCESYGIYYTNSTFAGVALAIVPIFSILIAFLVIREKPTRGQVLFSILPVAGVVMLTLAGSAMGVIRPAGVLLVFGACMCAAVFRVVNRDSSASFSAFERSYAIIGSSCIVFNLVALFSVKGDFFQYTAALTTPSFVWSTVVLAVFCSVTANLLVNYSAGFLSVATCSNLGSIITVCAMFAGVIFLREPMNALSLCGSVLVVVGIWLVAKEERKKAG